MKSAVPHSGSPSCPFVVLRALRVLPKTFHAFPSTPPVARLPRVLWPWKVWRFAPARSVHCSLFSRAAMPPLRSPGRASAPCTLAKDRAFTSLKSKQPHHPPHHTPSPKPVIGFPILPTPHPTRTLSHPPSLATSIQLGKHCFPNLPPHKNAPLSAAVESDTVGYTTITMEAGKWYQIGNPFVELEDGAVPTINTVFNTGFSDGDMAYIYNAGANGYSTVCQWGTLGGATGWLNLATITLDTTPLVAGQAVFIHKASAGEVILRGRVSEVTSLPFGSEDGNSWARIVCVHPTERSLNEMKWSAMADGDQAYIYDSATGAYKATRQWATIGGKSGWYNLSTVTLDTEKLPIGQAIFIHKTSKGQGTCLPATTAASAN